MTSKSEQWAAFLAKKRQKTAEEMRIKTALIPEGPVKEDRGGRVCRLTVEDVMWIRWGTYKSAREIARELNVDKRTIGDVLNYYTWRDVP